VFARRTFLAMTASGAAIGALDACAPPPRNATPPAPTPSAAPATPPPVPAPWSAPHADLEEATIASLSERMARGEITARALVERYLARIEAIDRSGPTLRSILEIDPDAIATADTLDDERRARGPRGPLHGIPVLVKDNIDAAGRTKTSAGSLALVSPAPRDARVVARLREAGAIVLGKTNLSEWANIRGTRSTSGWSARGGLTKNPYFLDRNTSGSSSGSAAAVSASLAAVALGTETDGSIVSPSSICGIVGVKPTVGLVSRAGIIPIAQSQDTAGPMTRTVTDAAILLTALAGADGADPSTQSTQPKDYATLLGGGVRGLRIGALREEKWISGAVRAAFEAALEDLRRLGAVVVDVKIATSEELWDAEHEVLLHELKAGMTSYLATRGDAQMRTLADVVAFNASHADELRWFGQEHFERALEKGPLDSPAYKRAFATCRRMARTEGIDRALAKDGLQALVAPTGGPAWVSDLVNGDHFTGSSSTLAAVAGYPSVTVPSGDVHGLPLGILFFAGAYSEAMLFRVAYAYEKETKKRILPKYATTLLV
jgi:amidase